VAVVARDSRLAIWPYCAPMETTRDLEPPTSGPSAAFQAESGEHLAARDDERVPAGAYQDENQEHAAPTAD
jgi:hypothetical protein